MDGVLLIDKPAGMTSHDVVAAVRRSLGGVKTGHAGTLDPFATGLLLVLLGRATKAQKALMELPKRYETVARLGAVSSTGDTEGEITETGRVPPDPPQLPTGEIRQRPPMHSAVKIGRGRALRPAPPPPPEPPAGPRPRPPPVPSAVKIGGERPSPRARRGEQFEMPERIVTVQRFQQLWREQDDQANPPRAGFEIECGSRPYVRSLIAALGA